MSENIGLLFESAEHAVAAVRFAQESTGIPASTVRTIFRSMDRYALGLGILPAELAEDADLPRRIREAQPDLFPEANTADRHIGRPLERAFILRETGFVETEVVAVLAAADEYMRRAGILLEPSAPRDGSGRPETPRGGQRTGD